MAKSHLEETALEMMEKRFLISIPTREYPFHQYRFDFAWPGIKVAVEVDGGTRAKHGGHAVGEQYRRDCIKRNKAQVEGWVVLQADCKMVYEVQFYLELKKVICKRAYQRSKGMKF